MYVVKISETNLLRLKLIAVLINIFQVIYIQEILF